MKTANIFFYSLGALIVLGFFFTLGYICRNEVPTGNKDLLNITVGALIGCFTSVVAYFFGSSKGSSDKSETLNEIAKDNKK